MYRKNIIGIVTVELDKDSFFIGLYRQESKFKLGLIFFEP